MNTCRRFVRSPARWRELPGVAEVPDEIALSQSKDGSLTAPEVDSRAVHWLILPGETWKIGVVCKVAAQIDCELRHSMVICDINYLSSM